MADEVRAIAYRRFVELEKVAATHGPATDPAVIIELQDIRTKYGFELTGGNPWRGVRDMSPQEKRKIEDDLLINTVAGIAGRQTDLEKLVSVFIDSTVAYRKRERREREQRQQRQDKFFIGFGAAIIIVIVFEIAVMLVRAGMLG